MAVLESASYDQYKNIPSYEDLGMKFKIIFSAKCYKNIMQMSVSSMNNNRERGSFFVGRIISGNPKVIYFDYKTSEFSQTSGPMGTAKAVDPTEENYNELNTKINEFKSLGIKPVVMHFHSHPRSGYYESFSDQDLQNYAKMQVQNKDCYTLGMLGFPVQMIQTVGMCIVRPDNSSIVNGIGTADFIRCEDISYVLGNDIYKVGSFEKKYTNPLYAQNLNNGIVRQYLSLSKNGRVCAEGIDPNTGVPIEPTQVGYVDTAGNLFFPSENLSFQISNSEMPSAKIAK